MNDAVFAQGLCYYKLFCTFIIGAILGDAVETVFCYRKYKTWLCRSSFMYGHMSVVWGFAFVIATILYYCMGEMNLLLIYLLGIMCGGVYEYFAVCLPKMLCVYVSGIIVKCPITSEEELI